MNSAKNYKLLTLKEASERLSVDVETLLYWNEHHILKPTITPNGEIGYTEIQIHQFLTIRQSLLGEQVGTEIPDKITVQEINEKNIEPEIQEGFQSNAHNSEKADVHSFRLISSLAVFFLVLIFGIFTQAENLKNIFAQYEKNQLLQSGKSKSVLSVQVNKPELSAVQAIASPIPLKNKQNIGNSISSEAENTNYNKHSVFGSLYAMVKNTQTDSIRSKNSIPLVKNKSLGVTQGNDKAGSEPGAISEVITLASRTGKENSGEDFAFDERGNIKGEAKDTLATILGGVGFVQNVNSLKQESTTPLTQIILIGIGLMVFIFVFPRRMVFMPNNVLFPKAQPKPAGDSSGKIIEVGQKTDGTIVIYFQEKEYKISKPELYSESDQFIERIMEIVNPGTKEIEYEAQNDEKIKLTTPLSRLVTRLGFVGIKRDLFFPRTSKERVLFRRFLSMQDLVDMNLTTDQVLQDLTTIS